MNDDREELIAYLDGELDAAGARRVEERLRTDPRLRAEADALQRTWALLDHLPRSESSPNFTSRTLTRVSTSGVLARPREAKSNWLRGLTWAAGLMASGAIGYAVAPSGTREVDLDRDPVYRADPRLIENLPLYLAVENLEFLQFLDSSDLFGEEAVGR